MDRQLVIGYLGALAAKNELASRNPSLSESSRMFLEGLANRYREAQFVEARKQEAERYV